MTAGPKTNLAAFTLIEMLVATVLAAVLMLAVLTMLSSVSRDRKLLQGLTTSQDNPGTVELLRWDIINSRTIAQSADHQSIVITGVGGIDNPSRSPDGRLVQITYEIRSKNLWRSQEYLDSATRNADWRELVASGVASISAVPSNRYVQLRISMAGGDVAQDVWIK